MTPEYAAQLLADPALFARFVAELDRRKLIVHARHVITLISPVPGVPIMVLRVIPSEHGKATADITGAIRTAVEMLNFSGVWIKLVLRWMTLLLQRCSRAPCSSSLVC